MSPGQASVLELRRGGVPYPHAGPKGEWRYRHAVRPEGPTPLDAQAVADFLAYEHGHGRDVEVVADEDLGDWDTWIAPRPRLAPDSSPTQCCTHAYRDGCGSSLVCHGTPVAGAREILRSGSLLPGALIGGRAAAELAAQSTWGEPPDYFDHVMFANGRCTAPEAVALSRVVNRDLVPEDLTDGYPPAVRLYFRWKDLAALDTATFDGVHPIKIRGALDLEPHLVALVVHIDQAELIAGLPLSSPIKVLAGAALSPSRWATMADRAAKRL